MEDKFMEFILDKVMPVMAVIALFLLIVSLTKFAVAVSNLANGTYSQKTGDCNYTTWDGHEYVILQLGKGGGITHSPNCPCITNSIDRLLQKDRENSIRIYMGGSLTNIPPYQWEYTEPGYFLCGGQDGQKTGSR